MCQKISTSHILNFRVTYQLHIVISAPVVYFLWSTRFGLARISASQPHPVIYLCIMMRKFITLRPKKMILAEGFSKPNSTRGAYSGLTEQMRQWRTMFASLPVPAGDDSAINQIVSSCSFHQASFLHI